MVGGQYLIPLSFRDRAGLEWLQQRASYWLRAMARRRKHLPPGPYSEDELTIGSALIELEKAAAILLGDEKRDGGAAPSPSAFRGADRSETRRGAVHTAEGPGIIKSGR